MITAETAKDNTFSTRETLEYINTLISGATENGEYVSFLNKFLRFEIEHEMYKDLQVVLKRAIAEKGFRTPEIMEFQPKSSSDCTLTLYAIYN